MLFQTDTIAAIATALNNSGIGIVRISGNRAIEIADSIFCTKSGRRILKKVSSHTVHYGYLLNQTKKNNKTGNEEYFNDFENDIIDEVLVSVFLAPKSYTAEDTVEINCHGGVLVIQKILETVIASGARPADPGEFTKRAFLNGRIDLSEAEAVMDLIQSQNEYALRASVNQLKGNLAEKIRKLRGEILHEIAFIESALDDPEHISLDGYPERLSEKIDTVEEEIQNLLATAESGRIVKEGISTVIVGKPNAGKSSLLNMILGQDRAIVTDIAGTTRDALEESVKLRGVHLNIIDTAGIRNTEDTVEKIGVEKARKYAKEADLILYVVDTSVELDDNDREIMDMIKEKKTLFLLNKSDLEQKVEEKDIFSLFDTENIRIVHTSAKEGEGLDQLEKEIEELFFSGNLEQNEEIMITNIRHKSALQNAFDSLQLVKKSLENSMPEDFYSIDLMAAYGFLGSIIGEEIEDDLVEEIFSKFCMGK